MPVLRIDESSDPRLDDYRHVPDPELLRESRIFVAEGRLVVRALLEASRLPTRSVLVTDTALAALADAIEPRLDALDVFVVAPGLIEGLTGFNIHRGCLAIGERPPRAGLDALFGDAEAGEHADRGAGPPHARGAHGRIRTLVVLEQVGNADNLGAIFRNAAAFGVDAVVLGPGCCDPLYRKAIRVSMGAALQVPFFFADAWPGALVALRERGFTVAALTPRPGAPAIDEFAQRWPKGNSLAILAGSEADGLTDAALAAADTALRIPIAPGVDSLNVATAMAIALHRLSVVR